MKDDVVRRCFTTESKEELLEEFKSYCSLYPPDQYNTIIEYKKEYIDMETGKKMFKIGIIRNKH